MAGACCKCDPQISAFPLLSTNKLTSAAPSLYGVLCRVLPNGWGWYWVQRSLHHRSSCLGFIV